MTKFYGMYTTYYVWQHSQYIIQDRQNQTANAKNLLTTSFQFCLINRRKHTDCVNQINPKRFYDIEIKDTLWPTSH